MVHNASRGIFKHESYHRSLLKPSVASLVIPRKFLSPYWGLKAAHHLVLGCLSDLIPSHYTSCSPNKAFKWYKQNLNPELCSNMMSAWLGIPTICQWKPLCLRVLPHWVTWDSAAMLVKIQIAGPLSQRCQFSGSDMRPRNLLWRFRCTWQFENPCTAQWIECNSPIQVKTVPCC